MGKKIVAFGEVLLRLTAPEKQLIQQANSFNVCYGGSEANVLSCLATLGNDVELLTALPNNSLGDAAKRSLQSYGIGTKHIVYDDNRLGIYYFENGAGERTPSVLYDRAGSSVSLLNVGAFDMDKVFEDCSIFHISGISFALSDTTRALCFELIKGAKDRGVKVSFDFNYRKKLWPVEKAKLFYKEILPLVDIVFASQQDINEFLDVTIQEFLKSYPSTHIFLREREVLQENKNVIFTVGYHKVNGELLKTNSHRDEFVIHSKIGSGDAFVGGILHILNKDYNAVEEALQCGIKCLIAKHSVDSDAFVMNKNFINGFQISSQKNVDR